MQMKDKLTAEKPLQMSGSVKGARRMTLYRLSLVGAGVGIASWWYWTQKSEEKAQDEAVQKFGHRGEKAEYGKSFQESRGDHFPGIPTTETNVRGGQPGGAVK